MRHSTRWRCRRTSWRNTRPSLSSPGRARGSSWGFRGEGEFDFEIEIEIGEEGESEIEIGEEIEIEKEIVLDPSISNSGVAIRAARQRHAFQREQRPTVHRPQSGL